MRQEKEGVSRKHFLYAGLGMMGGAVAMRSFAKYCSAESATGTQPLGPFFPREGTPTIPVRENQDTSVPISRANDNDLTSVSGVEGNAQGQIVYIKGTVVDEQNCFPIGAASIVVWQASQSGRYNHKGDVQNPTFTHPKTGEYIVRSHDPAFQYWGWAVTDYEGKYLIKTVVPGFYPANIRSGWYRPPHIHFLISAPGYSQLVTQTYFEGEQIENIEWIRKLNEKDLLLQDPNISRQQRNELVLHFGDDPEGVLADAPVGQFNIKLAKQ